MTTEQHPITPPPELVQRLRSEAPHGIRDAGVTRELYLITAAYQAGADQELEACCQWAAEQDRGFDDELRATRRPKPPSLKEQSLELIHRIQDSTGTWYIGELDVVRRALEQLPD